MQTSIAHLRSKFDRASALVDCALTYLEAQEMTLDTLPRIIGRINEMTGVLYRLTQIHKTLDRFEKNPAAAQNLESPFFAIQHVIDKFTDNAPLRPPRNEPPMPPVIFDTPPPNPAPPNPPAPAAASSIFSPKVTSRPADRNAPLRKISPLPAFPEQAPAILPDLDESASTSESIPSIMSIESVPSTLSSTSSASPCSSNDDSAPGGLKGRNSHSPGQAQRRPGSPCGASGTRTFATSPSPFDRIRPCLITPNPGQYIKYRDYFLSVRAVAPLTLRPINRMITGCANFLTEFIHDTCVRLSHAIRTHNPEFIPTLLPQLETILFPDPNPPPHPIPLCSSP